MPARPDEYPVTAWRKSRSSADAGNCVEIAVRESFVLVRDSHEKNRGVLAFTFGQWRGLMTRIRKGELDRGG